jgi:polysaccharide pyruvyl transferase WcaK-like protein
MSTLPGRINTISIFGSSSGRNAGDAALISGIMDTVDARLGRRLTYEIPTFKPQYVWKHYPNKVRPASMAPWAGSVGMFGVPTFAAFRRSDLAVVYDNMLFDRSLANPLFNYMPAVWTLFRHLRREGQYLGLYNCGLGPITTPKGNKMLREILEAAHFITVRDRDSEKLALDLGIEASKIVVTADAALTVQPCAREHAQNLIRGTGINLDTPVLGVNVNAYLNTWAEGSQSSLTPDSFAAIYGKAISQAVAEIQRTDGAVPVLFVTTQPGDIEITRKVMSHVDRSIKTGILENTHLNHFEIKGVLGELEFLFAMRLHANILATSMLTPAISLAFQKKVTSYYEELGLRENVASFETFSVESVANHLVTGWTNRAAIKATLTHNIPLLQAKAVSTAAIIDVLNQGGTPAEGIARCREELAKVPPVVQGLGGAQLQKSVGS